MSNVNSKYDTERALIEILVAKLRSDFPVGTPDIEILSIVLRTEDCTPEAAEKFAKKKKRFSTADMMQHFSVGKYKVAGILAALRRANKIVPVDTKETAGYSRWAWA